MKTLFTLLLFTSVALNCFSQEWDTTAHHKKNISSKFFEAQLQKNTLHPYQLNDSLAFQNIGWLLINDCLEICELMLMDKEFNDTLYLPSSFDQGVLDFEISSDGRKMFVISSYDGPEYYYISSIRSEVYVFSIPEDFKIDGIKLEAWMVETEFSIREATWINNHEIGLKTYSDNINIAERDDAFDYFSIVF